MTEYDIGTKLKELRLAKKLTLQSVAVEIGFSPSLISQIENNIISPPIATLSKLAGFFDVSISSFFTDDSEEPRYEIIRRDGRKTVSKVVSREGTCHGYVYEPFSFRTQNKKLEPFLITLSKDIHDGGTYSHEGEAFIFVLTGVFKLLLDGRELILNEGDCIYYDTSLEHRFFSKDGSEVTVLKVQWAK